MRVVDSGNYTAAGCDNVLVSDRYSITSLHSYSASLQRPKHYLISYLSTTTPNFGTLLSGTATTRHSPTTSQHDQP